MDLSDRSLSRAAEHRRRWLAAIGCLAMPSLIALPPSAQADNPANPAHLNPGVVNPPLALPDISLRTSAGIATTLSQFSRSHIVALQLMFTTCSATCPLQGALFAQLQQAIQGKLPRVRLLSVSIDPLNDTPASLRAWLQRFGADAQRWQAATPDARGLDALLDTLKARGNNGADRHTGQIYLLDSHARLAWLSADMPPMSLLLEPLAYLDRQG